MSILAPVLPGARVLDLYAGTGALGLEALSRGAASADFVDLSAEALAVLGRNIASLGVASRTRVLRGDALAFAARLEPGRYEIALADPPYAGDYAGHLVSRFRAAPFADVLAVEHAATVEVSGDDTRRYGDSALTFCFRP